MHSVYERYGDKWSELMKNIGNQAGWFKNYYNPNKEYWFKYCDLIGKPIDYNFSDILS